MFRGLPLLLLAAALAFSAAPARAEYSFLADTIQEVYSDAGKIPLTQANKIIQSADGYIWIASYDGLFRYDGRQAKLFTEADGFPSRSVMTIFEDSRGLLWIGTNNAGLVRYDSQAGFSLLDTRQGLPSNSVRAIAEDKQGVIYAATSLGLVTVSPQLEVRPVNLPDREPPFIIAMFTSQDDEVWCVHNSGGLAVLAGGKLVRHYPPRHFGQGIITSAFQASDGLIYLGTADKRVVLLKPGEPGQEPAYKILGTETQQHINGFYEDRQQRVWGCSDAGMGFFQQGRFYTVRGALIDHAIQSMTEDFEGNLWFASNRMGVLQVLPSSFKNVSLAASLPPLVVNAVERFQGRLYLGTDSGLIILNGQGRQVNNQLTRQLAGARIRGLSADQAGNLWISTYSTRGLVRYRADGSITSFSRASHGLLSDKVRYALPSQGRVLVGTAEGLSILRDNRVVKNYSKRDGLTNPVVMNIYESPEGIIYLGSDGGGVYKIDNGSISNYSEVDGLSSGIIMRLKHDPQFRGLWISTENGLCFWDERGIRSLPRLGQHGVNIFDIQLKGEDEIWLLGSGGVHIASRSNLLDEAAPLQLETLQRRDGLVYTITANAWNYRSQADELFICTNHGLLSIDMNSVDKRASAPRLLVSSVLIDEKEIRAPRQVTIPAEASRLTVNFSLISFTHSADNSVQAYLEGFDREPVLLPANGARSVSYTNLPGGRYTLNISGRNREGLASQTVSLPIYKESRFLEKPLARLALLLLVLLLGVLAARWYTQHKTRAILKRQAEYRAITDQAVQAIADTIDAKDRYTSGHSKRVAAYSLEIARRLGLGEKEREDLYYAALLHDIGKIGIGDSILNKDGRLTPAEYESVKNHVRVGGDILKSISVIKDIAVGARYHHERYDGSGYCEGLKGEEIPLFARIICVADAYDAMSTTRAYRAALSREYILEEFQRCAGSQFDGAIVPVMMEIIAELEQPTSP